MKYQKEDFDTFRLHTIQTKKFKTMTMKINFKRLLKREEITKRNLLSEILVKSTKKYYSERLMAIATEDLYGISYGAFSLTSGHYGILGFNFSFLSEEYTEEGIVNQVIDFMKEIIFHPNVENGAFHEEIFELAKQRVRDDIELTVENPNQYSTNRLYDLLDENSILAYHPEGTIEDLENITPKSLYDFYQDVLKNDLVDVFVLGDISEEVKKEIVSGFDFGKKDYKSKSHYVTDVLVREETKEVKEKSNFTQSKMCIAYNLTEMTDFERDYVSYVYSSILGGGGDSKLFQNVREKNSLCYNIGSFMNRIYSLMVIRLGFDQKNYDKVISTIQKSLEEMKEGSFEIEDIEKAKTIYKSSLQEIFDSPFRILNMYVSKEYLQIDDVEERSQKIDKVDRKMIMDFAKKVKLNIIYCLEGKDKNEEETK